MRRRTAPPEGANPPPRARVMPLSLVVSASPNFHGMPLRVSYVCCFPCGRHSSACPPSSRPPGTSMQGGRGGRGCQAWPCSLLARRPCAGAGGVTRDVKAFGARSVGLDSGAPVRPAPRTPRCRARTWPDGGSSSMRHTHRRRCCVVAFQGCANSAQHRQGAGPCAPHRRAARERPRGVCDLASWSILCADLGGRAIPAACSSTCRPRSSERVASTR